MQLCKRIFITKILKYTWLSKPKNVIKKNEIGIRYFIVKTETGNVWY